MSVKTTDFIKGDMTTSVIRFAFPLLCANLVQLLYSAADALFAGNMVGTAGIAAIGASSLVVTCVISFLAGFSVGVNVLVASKFGAQDTEALNRAFSISMLLALLLGVLFCIAGIAWSDELINLMAVPASVRADALSYVRIYFCSLPFIALYDNVASCLRGVGDSKTPLYAQIVGGIVNVALDAYALGVLDLGIDGVAWASCFSQGVAFLIAHFRARKLLEWHFSGSSPRSIFKIVRSIFAVGFPVAIQALCVTLSNTLIQMAINATGETNVAAFTAYFKIEMLIYAPLVALGQTTTVLAAQNIGAQHHWRVHLGVRRCILFGTIFAAIAAALLLVFRFPVVALFDQNAEVVAAGGLVMMTTFPFYWIYTFIEVYAGVCRGIGKAKEATMISLLCFVAMRLALLTLAQHLGFGLRGIAAIYPMTWVSTALLLGIYYYKFAHKKLHPAPHKQRVVSSE
ncbi:MATE family efflux transporter [Collinsella sp. AGMB00827]|uniref:MATE family efflux transporter n=1 Tax=Collinsella ureilytica TaxID=2869515 RepID=A0ABS7MJP1_9ACTN|nr:MATE family efflux transporter [Collinsella urealyticum]MBY4797305.1 MATE family efflux transporter [Collinsella urealyticum]